MFVFLSKEACVHTLSVCFIFGLLLSCLYVYVCVSAFVCIQTYSMYFLFLLVCVAVSYSLPPNKKASSSMSHSINHQNRSQARTRVLQLGNRVWMLLLCMSGSVSQDCRPDSFLQFCQWCQGPYGVCLVSHTCSVHESQKETYLRLCHNLDFLKTSSLSDFWSLELFTDYTTSLCALTFQQ